MFKHKIERATQWFFEWAGGDAEWYQFWRPGSGFVGGYIFGVVLFGLVFAIISMIIT